MPSVRVGRTTKTIGNVLKIKAKKRRELKPDNTTHKTIRYHWDSYQNAKKRIDRRFENIEEILDIKERLKARRLMGFKFNYSLQEVVQNFRSFHMFIEFDRTVKWLTIYNRKPVDHTEHVLEADPETINQIRKGNF